MIGDVRYVLDKRGAATCELHGDVGALGDLKKDRPEGHVERCRWWLYSAPGEDTLIVEQWGADYRVLRGKKIVEGTIELIPGSPSAADRTGTWCRGRPSLTTVSVAAVARHDLAHDGQPEAGALVGALRREERLEDLLEVLGRDAGAGVARPRRSRGCRRRSGGPRR